MLRRQFLLSSAAAIAAPQSGTRPRPNILFILTDDLGWGDLGCYGNRAIRTPHLDRLAREGTLFTQFYSNGSVCSPSRTAWITGQFPAHHRVHGHFATAEQNGKRGMPNFLDPAAGNVARQLKKAGYVTAHFGKWHLGHGPGAPLPDAYGFDTFCSSVSNDQCWAEPMKSPRFWADSTPLLVDETIRFLEKKRTAPFYAQVWTYLPHAPLDPTDEQVKPYAGAGSVTGHKTARQIYSASVTHLDAELGRLFRRMDELGLTKDTLVVFSSDNGPEDIHIPNAGHSAFGSPGPFRGRKRSLYEGGVRVPLLMRWPGRVPAGRVDDTSVFSAVDFLPTVCALAGSEVPQGVRLDGVDQTRVLEGNSSERAKPLFWEWRYNVAGYHVNRSPILAMREGRWKLLMNPDRSRVELYDIPKDPMEMTNLAGSQAARVEAMASKLLAWHKGIEPGPMDPEAGKQEYPWPGR